MAGRWPKVVPHLGVPADFWSKSALNKPGIDGNQHKPLDANAIGGIRDTSGTENIIEYSLANLRFQ